MEDFQECIEEYQECLEVVQICIEDDRSPQHFRHPVVKQQSDEVMKQVDSEPEISYKSICDITHSTNNGSLGGKTLIKLDSGEKTSKTDSEKDGYETCVDESFSDEVAKTPTNANVNLNIVGNYYDDNTGITVETLEMEIEQVSKELAKISKKKEHLSKKKRVNTEVVRKCRNTKCENS